MEALKCITDHLIPGRWNEARLPSEKELTATSVVQIEIEEMSAKVRTGPPSDKKKDYALDVWAGVLETNLEFGSIIPDQKMNKQLPIPQSVQALSE